MVDVVLSAVRLSLATLALVTGSDPAALGVAGSVALVIAAVVALAVTTVGATAPPADRGPRRHPTRAAELTAPLAQSDPDAAGHVRRRGPGAVLTAA
jgi:hypothetical protein